jgi:6,7-dimethyl-8-ribityllumazine synthase
MAVDVKDDQVPEPDLVGAGAGLRVAVVCGRFNSHVTLRLLAGVRRGLLHCAVDDVTEAWVPGAFEIPLACRAYAANGWDAVIGIGAVIRGETAHFEYVAGQCAQGLQQVGLDTGVPTVFGVLTTENLDQALARSAGPGEHNVGEEGARTAVEMVRLLRSIRTP